ncbi:P-loop containing nucleoside triphosphate hydrolase protein [Trametes gibbosa]|nr:P-loop containing nucleoside triphosphate hydrolase protein [Trametes gibbosa]
MSRRGALWRATIIDDLEAKDEADQKEDEDLQRALQLSLQEANRIRSPSSSKRPSPSTRHQAADAQAGSTHSGKDLDALDQEIEEAKAQRASLDALIRTLEKEREEKLRQIRGAQLMPARNALKGKNVMETIDYMEDFDWSLALRAKMKSVFGFNSFRLCQEGICNASMDGRDIVGIMPTGGGKSLGYQLPALMVPGCTLVVSPLLSLITDQILHLREANVDAVMLTSATSKEESALIHRRLTGMAIGDVNAPDIKLCYVTPEKIAKSKVFISTLQKLYRVNKLARFVIDEAHCISQQGHNFRPDYQRLSTLRQMFPDVPILALSATCPPPVLKDLLKTLNMPAPKYGTAADVKGTVLFSAPLYRKNLHYKVLAKPAATQDSIRAMCDYILEHHREDTGIVYCLTKKDAEFVAQELHEQSHREIRTGVYHADIAAARKEDLHKRWRNGQVNVVCATIAFGLGIDKGDVRFVLHHTLSTSLDGFYQESGRAGRDGKDADCILFYRPQDVTRISALTCENHHGREKVLAMLKFASDPVECRKILFARYFSESSNLSLNSWGTPEEDALTRCGHCDNCTRPPETTDRQDVRLPAWQLLRIAAAADRANQQLTMAQLCKLARGLRVAASGESAAGGARGRGGGKRARQEKESVDVQEVAGGKVELTETQTEHLCVRMLLDGFFEMLFTPTAYTVNVYLKPSATAARFTRFSRAEIEQGKGPAFECVFLKKVTKRKSTTTTAGAAKNADKPEKAKSTPRATKAAASSSNSASRGKRKRDASESLDEIEDDEDEEDGEYDDGSMKDFVVHDSLAEDSDEDEIMEWSATLRPGKRATKRAGAKRASSSSITPPWAEVIELSSD